MSLQAAAAERWDYGGAAAASRPKPHGTHTHIAVALHSTCPAGHRSPALPGVAARETEGSSPFDLGERCGILQTTAQVVFTLVLWCKDE
jgi:hypothetical protein